jgi:drug/metabolite transporter (DMT)-like permease
MTDKTVAPNKENAYVIFLLLITMCLWGGTFPAGKVAGSTVTPLVAAFWRFVLASLFLIPLCLRSPQGLSLKGLGLVGWLELVVSGLTGLVLYNYFFIKGLGLIEAGRAAVIVATTPAMVFLGSVIFFGEKLTLIRLLGISLTIVGTSISVTHGNPWLVLAGDLSIGDLLLFGCVLTWTIYSLISKSFLKRLNPLKANTWTVICAVIILLPLGLITGEPITSYLFFDLKTWFCLAFLGLGGTALGFTFFYKGIFTFGPHRAGIFINLVPVFGILFGWLLLNERLDLSLLVGLILNLGGIKLIHKF